MRSEIHRMAECKKRTGRNLDGELSRIAVSSNTTRGPSNNLFPLSMPNSIWSFTNVINDPINPAARIVPRTTNSLRNIEAGSKAQIVKRSINTIRLSSRLATIEYEKMVKISPIFKMSSQADNFQRNAVIVHAENITAITA